MYTHIVTGLKIDVYKAGKVSLILGYRQIATITSALVNYHTAKLHEFVTFYAVFHSKGASQNANSFKILILVWKGKFVCADINGKFNFSIWFYRC